MKIKYKEKSQRKLEKFAYQAGYEKCDNCKEFTDYFHYCYAEECDIKYCLSCFEGRLIKPNIKYGHELCMKCSKIYCHNCLYSPAAKECPECGKISCENCNIHRRYLYLQE